MNRKQHLFYGVLVGAALIALSQPLNWYDVDSVKEALTLFIVLGVSPLIPDLDHPIGKLHHFFLQVGGVILAIGVFDVYAYDLFAVDGMRLLLAGSMLIILTLLIGYAAPHRGIWHSIPICALYGVGVWCVTGSQIDLGVLAALGCYSPLVLDKEPLKLY